MELKRLLLGIFLTLLISPLAISANKASSFKQLKNELALHRSNVFELTASLKSVEKQIGNKNQLYIQKLEQMDKLSNQKDQLVDDSKRIAQRISRERARVQKVVSKYMGASLDDNLEQVFERAILKKVVSKKLKDIENLAFENRNILLSIEKIHNTIAEISDIEKSLQEVIQGLEDQKGELAQKYLNEVKEQELIEQSLERKKLERITKNKGLFSKKKFIVPTPEFKKYRFERKGISFLFKGATPIVAPGDGKVVYSGSLANYGQVIMIDHGDNLRTVLHGRFKNKIKKGDLAKQGQVIGYAKSSKNRKGSLYFEVRKKNKAQKAISYLNFKKDKLIRI